MAFSSKPRRSTDIPTGWTHSPAFTVTLPTWSQNPRGSHHICLKSFSFPSVEYSSPPLFISLVFIRVFILFLILNLTLHSPFIKFSDVLCLLVYFRSHSTNMYWTYLNIPASRRHQRLVKKNEFINRNCSTCAKEGARPWGPIRTFHQQAWALESDALDLNLSSCSISVSLG